MTRCAVLNCPNYTGKKSMDKSIRFHVFPKDPKIFREWAKVCRGKITNSTKYRICSAHFEESEFRLKDILLNVPKNKRCLKKDAIPTINVISPNSALLKRKIRIRKKLVEEALQSYEQAKTILPIKIDFSQQTEVQENENKEVQTEEIITGSDRELRAIKAEARVRRLKAKLEKERNRVTSSVCTESNLRTVFTAGQIRHLEQPDKKLRWSEEDIAFASTLYNAGGRAYRILIKRGVPLPVPSTVRRSREKFEVKATTQTTTTTTTTTSTLSDHTYCGNKKFKLKTQH